MIYEYRDNLTAHWGSAVSYDEKNSLTARKNSRNTRIYSYIYEKIFSYIEVQCPAMRPKYFAKVKFLEIYLYPLYIP